MHALAKRFLSLTILATAMAGASTPAKAQSLGQLKADILALDLPSEKGMLHLIIVAEDFIDVGELGKAIKPLNALMHSIDAAVGIDNSTADALHDSIVSVIDVLVAGPQEWWCDHDGDGYTIYAGVSLFAPSAYCSNDPGLGTDNDDNDPYVPTLREWWCDYDQDNYYVFMGFFAEAPTPYCYEIPGGEGVYPDCDDNDPGVTSC